MTERVSFSAPAVKRAIAAVEKAGKVAESVEISPNGKIRVWLLRPDETPISDRSGRDWEVVAL